MRGLTPWGEQRRERSPAGKPRVNPSGQARLRFNPQRQLPTAAIPKPSYLSPYVERPHPGIEIHGTLVCCERRNSTRRGTFLRHLADGVPEVDRHHRSHAGIDPCRHPSAADRPRRHARSRGHKPAGVRAAGRVGLRRTSRGSQRRSALRHSRCAGVDDDRVGRGGPRRGDCIEHGAVVPPDLPIGSPRWGSRSSRNRASPTAAAISTSPTSITRMFPTCGRAAASSHAASGWRRAPTHRSAQPTHGPPSPPPAPASPSRDRTSAPRR